MKKNHRLIKEIVIFSPVNTLVNRHAGEGSWDVWPLCRRFLVEIRVVMEHNWGTFTASGVNLIGVSQT